MAKSLSADLFIHSSFWSSRLESLSHPVAIRMAQDLDSEGALGIGDAAKAFWKGFKHDYGDKDSNIDFLFRVKKQHAQKIILIQIGEFYETWGIDSVFLVEHCGINRMGRKGPRAGMPIANIQSVLDDLTEAGFSVVVCEQADDVHKKGRKIRFISEVITPSSPTYTYGLAMSHKANICFPEAPPEFGIAVNSKGVKVVEINPDLRTALILEGLTEEAAIIRLNKYSGRMNRIFLHEKTPKSLLDAANLKFQNLVRVAGYSSRAFPKRMEEMIKIDLGLDANIAFLKSEPVRVKDAPNPLYQQTAEQIGILPRRGIPDLVQLMLPKGSPATCKYIVRNLLLNPPPKKYAESLRRAISELQFCDKQLPILIVSNPVRYIKTLNKNEAHPEILKDLFCLAEIFLGCYASLAQGSDDYKLQREVGGPRHEDGVTVREASFQDCHPVFMTGSPYVSRDASQTVTSEERLSPQCHPVFMTGSICASLDNPQNFIKNILEIVSYISSIKAEAEVLHGASKKIIAILSSILPKEEDLAYTPKSDLIPATLFERIEEEFRGRVARTSNEEIAGLYRKAEKAAQKYEEALTKNLLAIIGSGAEEGKKSRKLALSYDIHNHAIWLLGGVNPKIIQQHQLIRPLDRYGKEVKDRWTTIEVEEALKEYKSIATSAYDAIKQILKKASRELAPYCLPIIHLATFSNLVKTLYLHIKECQPKNWTTNFFRSKSLAIALEDFFPYWMKAGEAVTNSLSFDGTCLLTGHNMSGKSTLIRSLAATTLLGSAGFMFPAKSLNISEEIDGWFVRTGAGDDPEAGLSAFAVEMTDIKVALRDASSKSFLLIDELGKGTESRAGHAIAASVLEHLAQRNIRSIFATHWHEIFVNPAFQLKNIRLIKMQCEGNIPTYEVVDGVDLNSSAFYTASKIGVEQAIVARAEEIAQGYDRGHGQQIFSENFLNHENPIDLIKEILALTAQTELAQIKNLRENETPPLNDIGHSVVYILKTENNFFYVGETDNFLYRVNAHRNRLADDKCEFFYVTIKEGKSQARQIEQRLITKLKNHGFPMISVADARNANFGAARGV